MKTLRTTAAALMIMLTSIVASAQPMSVYSMRNNARFLTDRMAYTLGLSAAILDELYYINYDYICGVNDYLDDVALGYRYDDYMAVVYARDRALRRLLTERQWTLLMSYDYFYRPISFHNHRWSFGIYRIDKRINHFFFGAPRRFNDYRGGTVFAGMRRNDMPMGAGHPAGGNNHGIPQGGSFHIGDAKPGNTNGRDVRADAIRQSGIMNSNVHQGVTQNRTQTGTQNSGGDSRTSVTSNQNTRPNMSAADNNRTSTTVGRTTSNTRNTATSGSSNQSRTVGNSGIRESSTRSGFSGGSSRTGRR